MTSPPGPAPAEGERPLLDFLRRNPARHRAIAAVALALVAGATVGRACDPLRLHALVATSMITALLVVSDLFVAPGHPIESAARRGGLGIKLPPWPAEADHALPNCPTCGLPVFAQADDAPALYLGLSWRRGPGDHPLLFPMVTARLHANDDRAPDPCCLALAEGQAAPADNPPPASASGSVPEMVGLGLHPDWLAEGAAYAGSRLKTVLDMMSAGALLIVLAPLMLAIAFILAVLGGRPILVHQERLDWLGGCFRVSKFRCSFGPGPITGWCAGAGQPEDGNAARPDRPEPQAGTAFEIFLYRSGLASLPLLLSILRGDLSFVGPDPAMPDMSAGDRIGAAIVAESASRLGARPGLTGWAEVHLGGKQGRAITARQKIACDLYYLEHSSPLLDLRILARALDAMTSRDHAS